MMIAECEFWCVQGITLSYRNMPVFMNCVYWGRLVENLFCVVSIENDCYSKYSLHDSFSGSGLNVVVILVHG